MGWDGMKRDLFLCYYTNSFSLALSLFFFLVEIWFLALSFWCSSVLFFPLSRSPSPPNFPVHTIPHTMQTLSTSTSLLSLLSAIIAPTAAYVTWLYPPSSSSRALSFNYNDVVYFSWESNFTAPSITLWCASDDDYYSRELVVDFFLFALSHPTYFPRSPPPTDI